MKSLFFLLFCSLAHALYTNSLKSWELDKEVPQNFWPERVTIAERQGASEDRNLEVKPTKSKTKSSSCLCITPEQAQKIGQKIWQNECGGKISGLTSWNLGEDFPSLGIGHFIWYPDGVQGPFTETFPAFVSFLQQQGCSVPTWLAGKSPWQSRKEFIADIESSKMEELQQLLLKTVDLQALFIAERLNKFREPKVKSQLQRLLEHPMGLYAVIDYLNFKGEGTNPKERYQGEGWGLLQVLEGMDSTVSPLPAFVTSAKKVLKQRVELAPKERNEFRWLKGWENRLETYLQ